MLHRLVVRDFVIVDSLELDFGPGLTVLTGETGAGKSILVDALQLALGGRADAGAVREGAARSDVSAEFDAPRSLAAWLDGNGHAPGEDDDASRLLLRRTVDAQGKSRAWINGLPSTVTQLREAADALVDIHGQHAWQSLMRPAAVRAIVDAHAGVDAAPLAAGWSRWRAAVEALEAAQAQAGRLDQERDRLAWQLGEVDKLAPGDGEWAELDAEHARLANAQALIDAASTALGAIDGGQGGSDESGRGTGGAAGAGVALAVEALDAALRHDARLGEPLEALRGAQAQLRDAAHTLASYLDRAELDPERLRAIDERLSAWHGLARRHRRAPGELPALAAQWRSELAAFDAAADLDALAAAAAAARKAFDIEAKRVSAARKAAAPGLSAAVTKQIRGLGMAGGAFSVVLEPVDPPQSFGAESAAFEVAGHAGSAPRPLAKVASGGELSRIALALAVVGGERGAAGAAGSAGATGEPAKAAPGVAGSADEVGPAEAARAGTLIFDEVDAGIGGAVAETVGRLMKRLGHEAQVLAVTHLPQVAACADRHLVVSKSALAGGHTTTRVGAVAGESRVAEIARMLGGEKLSSTSLAHAQEMLASGAEDRPDEARSRTRKGGR